MSYLDPREAAENLQKRVLEGIRSQFPDGVIKGKVQSLHLDSLSVKDDLDPGDIRDQHAHKLAGETWSVPVYANLTLRDNATGSVVDSRKMRIADIPKMTNRYSYIVASRSGAKEYQVNNQWQLKPGVYTQRRKNGELETRFNIKNRKSFDVVFDPASKVFHMEYGKSSSKIPLYQLVQTLGVGDDVLEKAWGKEVYEANKNAAKKDAALSTFYKSTKKMAAPDKETAAAHFYDMMTASTLRPDATELTLGKPFEHVTGDALTRATQKLLRVQGGEKEDDRESLIFKDLRSVGDFAHERILEAGRKGIQRKISAKINSAKNVRDVVQIGMFNKPILETFQKNAAAGPAAQINPVEMLAASFQTTVMGPGGIQSDRQIKDEVKFINASHLGFLDPINTPEGASTGVTLRLPFGLTKVDHTVNGEARGEARIPLYNLKTQKIDLVSPGEASKVHIVLPDQVRWENGKPKPIADAVQMTGAGGEDVRHGKFSDAQYVIRYPSQLFNMTSNLLPFLANTSGGRASMASRHMEQAISLVNRKPPLVQVGTGYGEDGGETFERLMGGLTSHTAPFAGQVTAVTKDGVTVRSGDGRTHEVQIYNNFPVNEAKGVLDSTPVVKVGDRVKKDQVVADTNYSKNGVLALGNNLRVAYIPFKGYNFEDGVVISQSAADALASAHMHKPSVPIDDATVLDKKRFMLEHHGLYSKGQFDKLDDKGIIRVGQKVKPGDPLIAAMKPYQLKDRTGMAAVRKMMGATHTDKSLRWDSEFEGDVVGVHHSKEGVTVHVRTVEPMQVGDKLAGRHGNKGICFDPQTQVLTERGWSDFDKLLPADRICTLNPVTHHIEYQSPERYIELDYTGPMYRFEGRRLDLMTTPNHKHFVRTARRAEYRLESAEECFGHQRVHLRTGVWDGEELETFTVPGRLRREGSRDHYEFCEPRTYDADDFLEFFGYWVTEGSVNGSHIDVAQRKEKNPETYEAIRQVLVRLGYEPFCGADVLTISDPRLSAWLGLFGTSLEKFIPSAFLFVSKRQLRILADALFAGDGGVYYSERSNHTRYELFTSSPRLADDYQELALKLGMSANIKPQDRKDKKNIEYVVRWSLKDEVYTTKDTRYAERSERWVDYSGKVYCVEVPNHVIYVRRNGIPVWSGNCTMILPDVEMPHTKDGKHIEVALNPSGVPGRMNVSQVLETAAGKIAEKTGKPYIVQNFQPKFDALKKVTADLKAHGIEDEEELFDPATKQSLGKALVGPQHLLKLVHQVEKKLSVRSGMNIPGTAQEGYDLNLQPVGGSGTGGPSIGGLDLYALLAHGAKANLREMQTYKSEGPDPQTDPKKAWPSDHTAIWASIQSGGLLPPPKPTFAYQKFTDLLRAAGVNVDKNGHGIALSPMTDAQVVAMAPKALPNAAERLNTKLDQKGELKPKTGGLFDERLTGGHGGRQWTRIELSEPVPNPFFEKAICSVAKLSKKDFEAVVGGERGVSPTGQLTDLKAGVTGGAGIKLLLDKVDVRKELPLAQMALDAAKGQKIDPALKRVKFLRALSGLKLKPSEAYVLHNLPVLPPVMRPITPMPDGNLKPDDLNQLYSDFAKINDKLKDPVLKDNLTEEGKRNMRAQFYDGVKALMGVGTPYADAKEKGILHRISGSSPKHGYFQNVLLSRRQDLSMRSTIVPEPSLGLDEVGLPRTAALDLFRPFVARKLKELGAVHNELEVAALLMKPNAQVWKALDKVMEERPVLLKRDPVLHKYSIQAFKARPVEGNAIKIHPLVTGGFNADFDGDTMSAYVPITREAVTEARKMFPSNNLFSDASGKSMYQPTLESALGLYKLSVVGKDTGKKFADPAQVLSAAQKGHIEMTDQVHLPGGLTTPGRVLLASAVPAPLEKHMLHDMTYRLDNAGKKDGGTKGLDALLMRIAKEHTASYDSAVNKLKDLGNGAAFGSVMVPRPTEVGHPFALGKMGGAHVATTDPSKSIFIPMPTHSLSLKDFVPDIASREHVLVPVQEKVKKIYEDKKLTKTQKDSQAVALYQQAATDMQALHVKSQAEHPTNLFTMYKAGVKPGWDQYKQMVLAPMIYRDAYDRPIPNAVTKSYSEGLDMGSYWTQMHGARRGAVMKVQEVEKPGALSKLLMQSMLNVLVDDHDCGTKHGIALSVNEADIHDRYLQQDFTHGKLHVPAGTLLTTDVVGKMRAADPHAEVVVRSPLKCEEEHGICQKCAGLTSGGQHYELGTNVGVQAAHAVGERAIQLTLKSFHCMHEHSLVLVRSAGRIFHTTLGQVFDRGSEGTIENGEERRLVGDLEVWDRGGWVAVRSARRHLQQAGTAMVFTRSRAGYGVVSQDNHPHMLVENTARCSDCRTYPKRDNGGRQFYCRKCRVKFPPAALVHSDTYGMVEPQELRDKSHAAMLDTGPTPTCTTPPLVDGWLAGIFCAEGCIHTQQTAKGEYVVGIAVSQNANTETYVGIGDALRREFGAELFGPHPKGYQVYGTERGKYLQKSFGRYSRNKGLPDGWSGIALPWLAAFVAGVFDGDGTLVRTPDSAWSVGRIDTTSFLLAQQVHWILRLAGVQARIIRTPWRKISLHQPFAVTFVVTERVKEFLSASMKLAQVPGKPLAQAERFGEVVDYVRPIRFGSTPFVYDLETASGTLFVGGMWTHNTGGVGEQNGSKLLSAFAHFDNLLRLPKKLDNQATLASSAGTVDRIQATTTGADVFIGGKKHHIGKDASGFALHENLPGASIIEGYIPWAPPKVGMKVAAGQHLSDPNRTVVNPHHLFAATGSMDTVQNHLTNEIFKLYKNEGLKRRAIETVVKSMGSLTRIEDPGDHDTVLRGEFRPLPSVRKMNEDLLKAGQAPIEHIPVLKGIDIMPRDLHEDWMAKLQHNHLRETLQEAAAVHGVSLVHGHHPIPALAFGAEIGLTKKDSLVPGQGHLKTVADHLY